MTKNVITHPRFDAEALIAAEGGWRVSETKTWGWVERHLPGGKWDLAPQELVDQLASASPPQREAGEFFLLARRQRHKINSTLNDGLGDAHGRSPPGLFVHPDDALRLDLIENGAALVESSNGSLQVVVHYDDSLALGCVNIPHGFEAANVGCLTNSRDGVDRLSGMPELTALKVRITPV